MNNLTEILNEINKIPEVSLLDKIISYCEQNDLNPQELGDELAESEHFKRRLWMDCVNNNSIQDNLLKQKWEETDTLDEW